jgi:PAS domain S-box-containing protein
LRTSLSTSNDRGTGNTSSEYTPLPLPDVLPAEKILDAVAEAIYTTDAEGRITYYNRAAAELWGACPEIGKAEFCGSWKLYHPDGTPLPHNECPMAIALSERRAVRGMTAIAERPDGTQVPFLAAPTPIFDASGVLIGAVNMLMDLTEYRARDEAARRYAAIVEHSDDAIVAKDLKGIITAWNRGAERLFGYTAAEAIGKPVTMLIPADRPDEEPSILARIRLGERVEHYETTRQRKDGTHVEISLTVSPVKDERGRVIGASKIARDITERRRAEEQRRLLLREMDHRVKNMLALAGSVVSASARSETTVKGLSSAVSARLVALAQAHSLVLNTAMEGSDRGKTGTTLHALIKMILAPYREGENIPVSGADIPMGRHVISDLALLLHEFATNAAKYGALSTAGGRISIAVVEQGADIVLTWVERGGPVVKPRRKEGFGTLLVKTAISGQLGGRASYDWQRDGLTITMSIPKERLQSRS